MKRLSARAMIITKDAQCILIHRKWRGREYFVTPGGGVEDSESLEDALKREVHEEVGIMVEVQEQLLDITKQVDDRESRQVLFVCKHLDGEIGTGTDASMLNLNPSDFSEVVLVSYQTAQKINIVPIEVKEVILQQMKQGWGTWLPLYRKPIDNV